MLTYCDKIAAVCSEGLKQAVGDEDQLIAEVKGPYMDLHPEYGFFRSTMKTIFVEDVNGQRYKITVEEFSE